MVRNISFSWDRTLGKSFLLHVNQDYKPDNPNKTLSYFTNLSFVNLSIEAAPPSFPLGDITCLPQSPCEAIQLTSLALAPGVESPRPLECTNVHGVQTDVPVAVAPPSCTGTVQSRAA